MAVGAYCRLSMFLDLTSGRLRAPAPDTTGRRRRTYSSLGFRLFSRLLAILFR